MPLDVIILQIVGGLSEGMIVFLCAMGLTLILGSLKVLNISHGSIYMIGSYFVVTGNALMLALPGHFYLALIAATLGAAIVGGIIEVLVVRPIYKLDHIYQFITTFAVTFIVMDLVKIFWGGSYHTLNYPSYLQGPITFSGLILPKYNVALILFGIAVFVAMYLFIHKSRFGLVVRGITVCIPLFLCLAVPWQAWEALPLRLFQQPVLELIYRFLLKVSLLLLLVGLGASAVPFWPLW